MNKKWFDDIGDINVMGSSLHESVQTLFLRGSAKIAVKNPGSIKITDVLFRKSGDLISGPLTEESLVYFCEYIDSIFAKHNFKTYFESKSSSIIEYGLVGEEGVAHYTIGTEFTHMFLYTTNFALAKEIKDFIESCYVEYIENEINVLIPNQNSFTTYAIGRTTEVFESDNYAPDVVESYNFILKYFGERNPFGRLLLLHGEPGTGKTHFVKAIINNIKLDKCKIIYLQSSFISHGGGINNLLNTLITSGQAGRSIVLILEDADDCLVPRGPDNMTAISNLLNLADGMLGSMLDVRIIATSNAKRVEMDKALLRPGRLCKQVEIGKLSIGQAESVYYRLTGKKINFDIEKTLAEVYEAANGRDVKEVKKSSVVGFSKGLS